jgi:hypothetical protein
VSGEIAVIPLLIVVAAALAWLVLHQSARVRGTARRYRQLELEGVEELRRGDPYTEELERALDDTMRRRKGAPCLL